MRAGIAIGFVLVTVLILAVSRFFNPYLIVLLLLPVFSLIGMYRSLTRAARETKRDARALEKTFAKELLRDAAVIDSAVWQNEHCEHFFEALSILFAATGKKIVLYDCQLQELTGSAGGNAAGEAQQEKTARATALIEQFRMKDIITLAPSEPEPGGGPPAVRALICAAGASRNVTLVSDNRELIREARRAMKQQKTGLTVIDNLEELAAACRKYCAAVAEKKVIPAASVPGP
jgi:hypothetical protein